MMRPALRVVLLSSLLTHLGAHDLGGGSTGRNGAVPRLKMTHWIPGQSTELQFTDVDAGALGMAVILSPQPLDLPLPGFGGARLKVDPGAPGAIVIGGFTPAFPNLPLGAIPSHVSGTIYMQGIVVDTGATGSVAFTNGTKIDLFNPLGAVGNSRQSANSIQSVGRIIECRFFDDHG